MTDPDEEQQKLERDMWRVVWILLPIAAFIFLLLVIQRFALSQCGFSFELDIILGFPLH